MKQELEKLYIVDPTNFKGSIESTVYDDPNIPLDDRWVHYTDQNFRQYNEEHKGVLVAVNHEEFMSKYFGHHLLSLQGSFKETTEEKFMDGLECLPPLRWIRVSKMYQFFFVGEPYTMNIYQCFVQRGNKFYTALRSIDTNADDLMEIKDKV